MRETTQIAGIFAVMESAFAGLFAVIAILLATTSIYGMVAYRTALRMREIGIRVALGASLGDVLRLVLLQGFRLTLAGLEFRTGADVQLYPLHRHSALRYWSK